MIMIKSMVEKASNEHQGLMTETIEKNKRTFRDSVLGLYGEIDGEGPSRRRTGSRCVCGGCAVDAIDVTTKSLFVQRCPNGSGAADTISVVLRYVQVCFDDILLHSLSAHLVAWVNNREPWLIADGWPGEHVVDGIRLADVVLKMDSVEDEAFRGLMFEQHKKGDDLSPEVTARYFELAKEFYAKNARVFGVDPDPWPKK
jgi:hypothetical protein